MNVILDIKDFNINNVFFFEKIKNNIIFNGFFIKLIYSTSYYALNSIILVIEIFDINYENNFNKTKCIFETKSNIKLIEKIKEIEYQILKKINIEKTPIYKLYESIKNGYIKIFNYSQQNTINGEKYTSKKLTLKISGLWISENNYGLSYKFNRL